MVKAWWWSWVLGGVWGCAASHAPVPGAAGFDEGEPVVLDAARPVRAPRADAALPEWWVEAGGSVVDAEAGLASGSAKEVCNGRDDDGDGKLDEGCPRLLGEGTELKLAGARLIWQQRTETGSELWTALLPEGPPVLVGTGARQMDAATDGQRIVHSDYEAQGFVLVDMRDGSKRAISPPEPKGRGQYAPDIEGDLVAYAQSYIVSPCGGWCDEIEVYLYDLRTGLTQLIAPGKETIQTAPLLSAGQLVWLDDRYGHHLGEWGGEHWVDVFAATLPYDGAFRRLTFANPRPIDIVGFEAGRLLTREEKLPGLSLYQLMDVASGRLIALDKMVAPGDGVLDLSASQLLVQSDPLGRCALRLIGLETQRVGELETDGRCPASAALGDGFVAWSEPAGAKTQIYWMDVRDVEMR